MTELKTIELDSLVGEHVLDGVDLLNERVKIYGENFEDASVIRFRLDGVVYTAIEDPDDGYRSSMEKIYAEKGEIKNAFPPVKITARKKPDDGQTNDTLELIDAVTGKVIVEVGTDNTDDYYPYFVSAFWPENMVTNAK